MAANETEVIVIGAGVAGLRCAVRLTELGRQVTVMEAADEVGGRIRTDQINGFLCDHGFQVFNPAYPAVKRWVDVDALGVQSFGSGVLVRREAGLKVVADPVRSPKFAREAVRSGFLKPREIASLGRWIGPTLVSPRRTVRDADETLEASLDRAGVTGTFRSEVLQPFLAGVSVDSHEQTSANLSKLLVRMFAVGRPGLPRDGMQAFPEQLAAAVRVGGGTVERRNSSRQRSTDPVRSWRCAQRARRRARRAVVIAADPLAGSTLAGLPEPAMKGLNTWWFAANEAPNDLPLIAIDGRRTGPTSPGPIWNAAVITNAAPSYAPDGRHLISATTLLDRPDGEAPESAIRSQLADIYGCDTSAWELLTRHHIPHALPAYPPPMRVTRPVDVSGRVFVCGDHRDTPSIQGALVSGNRTAELVNASLS